MHILSTISSMPYENTAMTTHTLMDNNIDKNNTDCGTSCHNNNKLAKPSLPNILDFVQRVDVPDSKGQSKGRFYCRNKRCQKLFSRQSALKSHMQICDETLIQKKEDVYFCSVCGKVFDKIQFLQRHFAIHYQIRPFVCNDCGEAFNQKSVLITHIKIKHIDHKHACNLCPAVFPYKGNLTVHKLTVHSNKKKEKWKCPCCNSYFKKKYALSHHHAKYHQMFTKEDLQSQDNMPDVQDQEEKSLALYYDEVKNAKHDFDGKRWYKCQKCSAVFKKPFKLLRHIEIHTDKGFHKCSVCNESFRIKTTLKNHERSIHNINVKMNTRKDKYLSGQANDTNNLADDQYNANKSITSVNDVFSQQQTNENDLTFHSKVNFDVANYQENCQNEDLARNQNSVVSNSNDDQTRSVANILALNNSKEDIYCINFEKCSVMRNSSPVLTDVQNTCNLESSYNFSNATLQDDPGFTPNNSFVLNLPNTQSGVTGSCLMESSHVEKKEEFNVEKKSICEFVNSSVMSPIKETETMTFISKQQLVQNYDQMDFPSINSPDTFCLESNIAESQEKYSFNNLQQSFNPFIELNENFSQTTVQLDPVLTTNNPNIVGLPKPQVDFNGLCVTDIQSNLINEKPNITILSNVEVVPVRCDLMPESCDHFGIKNNFFFEENEGISKENLTINQDFELFPVEKLYKIKRYPKASDDAIDEAIDGLLDYKYLPWTKIKPQLYCKFCNKLFYKQADLLRHTNKHKQIKTFVCDICNKGFSFSSTLKNHKRLHLPKKERPLYNCKQCDKAFASKGSLKIHTTAIHNNILTYSCPFCDEKFRTPVIKSRHIKKIHLTNLIKSVKKKRPRKAKTKLNKL